MNKINYDSTGDSLFSVETIEDESPVTCLGIEFKNDRARKEYFLNLLAEKLKDLDFRKIEGFPIGSDDDILALSDPPYYCACPNPWLNDFIKEWEAEKPEKPADWIYKREPFAADINEGKGDAIYNVHPYHTKVPPKAIMSYLEHYTEPGDIVLDAFCGSGMTGVAVALLNEQNRDKEPRKCLMNDLSPEASFITFNHTHKQNIPNFIEVANSIISELQSKVGWVYETRDENGDKGIIDYVVWSDIVLCPNCGAEIEYYTASISNQTSKYFECPQCGALIKSEGIARSYSTYFDNFLSHSVDAIKQVPVFIKYKVAKALYKKVPDENDLELISKIESTDIPFWVPTDSIPRGDKTGDPTKLNITNVHQFYTRRNLLVLATLRGIIEKYKESKYYQLLLFWFSSIYSRTHKMNRYMPAYNRHVGPFAGTLYIPYIQAEINIFNLLEDKLKSIQALSAITNSYSVISVNSSTKTPIDSSSIDYIFIDPPFGSNIMYSELSFIWESWLRVRTNNKKEAISNKSQNKNINEYRELMFSCFNEFYRVLKPGHWMTIEFSNTNNSVWNSIQTTLSDSGFIVANVSCLDKGRGGLHAIVGPTSVKQDLIISAYKPDSSFEFQITSSNGTDGVWTFIRKHLEYLPVVKETGLFNKTYSVVPERDPRILFDRLVSYYVGHNILLPISSPDFLAELSNHFIERDGLYYLPEQVVVYDKLKAQGKIGDEDTTGSLFVHDESSAIAWIREQLKKKTMTTGEMTPLFMQELNSWDKNEKRLELAEILEENFLRYDGVGDVPSPIHSYLSTNYKELRNMDKDNPTLMAKAKGRWYVPDPNKQADLEKLREKGLLREFNGYLQTKGKLKEFRLEAVRAGFKKAWSDKDYKLIIDFAARIPSSVIEEDPKLLMWYNGAVTRSER